MTEAHKGHRGQGGIQEHSCGPLFPFMIRGLGDTYQAFHACGWEGIQHPYTPGDLQSHGPAHDKAEAQCQKYQGNANTGRPKVEFLVQIRALDDAAFVARAEKVLWFSAFANNNPRSDYHWQADACYDEAIFRGNPGLYDQALAEAKRQ